MTVVRKGIEGMVDVQRRLGVSWVRICKLGRGHEVREYERISRVVSVRCGEK